MSEVIFKFIAIGVPAIMVLGGILLLFTGYPLNDGNMIAGGWVLAILGALIYIARNISWQWRSWVKIIYTLNKFYELSSI